MSIVSPGVAVENIPLRGRFSVPPKPAKRLVKTFSKSSEGVSWQVITEWWSADSPHTKDGEPDIDPETGDPTGYYVTQRLARSRDGETEIFSPVIHLDDLDAQGG